MCGRFVLTSTTEHIQQSFGVDDVPSIASRYNIAPTQDVLVIRQNGGEYAPFPADLLEAIPISTKINNPRHDSPDCLEPLN